MREFDIKELLFRKPIVMHDEKTKAYYKDKVTLITSSGCSIGSELCRQLAKIKVVPTYKTLEEVNAVAKTSSEMSQAIRFTLV